MFSIVFIALCLSLAVAQPPPTIPELADTWTGQCKMDSTLNPFGSISGPCYFDASANMSRIDGSLFGTVVSEIRWFWVNKTFCDANLGAANCIMDPTHHHSLDFQVAQGQCEFSWQESFASPYAYYWSIPPIAQFSGYQEIAGRNCSDWRYAIDIGVAKVQIDVFVDQTVSPALPVQSVFSVTGLLGFTATLSIDQYTPGLVDPSVFHAGVSTACVNKNQTASAPLRLRSIKK